MDDLGVRPPRTITRVSDHITSIINYIASIEKRGYVYTIEGSGVYFDVNAFGVASYGKLAPNSIVPNEDDNMGTLSYHTSSLVHDVISKKRNKADFALWKYSKSDEEPSWRSPWGDGRPGWHIECSAMTNIVFGTSLDIHAGGVDLAFPHHCNEIAQCEAFVGKQEEWVKIFMVHTYSSHI